MLAASSSHKRRRSATRADAARAAPGGRVIAAIHRAEVPAPLAHPFNHAIDVLVPSTESAPQQLDALRRALCDAASAPGTAYLARVPATLFLDATFVASYVRTGSLYALSASHLDRDDVMCLDGQGMLILSLTKETYQTLGLVGRPSRYAYGASGRMGDRKSGPTSRYIVELPLLDPSFVPGKKGFTRAYQCLQAWDAARVRQSSKQPQAPTWNMFFAWTPPARPDAGEAPALGSIQFPSLVRSEDVHPIPPQIAARTEHDAWVPAPQTVQPCVAPVPGMADDSWKDACCDVLEWCGLASIGSPRIKTYDRCDVSVAQVAVPQPCEVGAYLHVRYTGFFPPAQVQRIQQVLEHHRGTAKPSCAWNFVNCAGFTDAPISWQSKHPALGLPLGTGHSMIDDTLPDAEPDTPSRKKPRNKGHIRRGESEHGFLRTGENGWCMLHTRGGTLLIESVELDTRS